MHFSLSTNTRRPNGVNVNGDVPQAIRRGTLFFGRLSLATLAGEEVRHMAALWAIVLAWASDKPWMGLGGWD